jgi:hypothetical protein
MNQYFNIVYINTEPSGGALDLPDNVKNIRDWMWQQSALVRWHIIERRDLNNLINIAGLVILDWSSRNVASKKEDEPQSICEQIRNHLPRLPILIISDAIQTPARETFVSSDTYTHAVLSDDLTDTTQIETAFNALNARLLGPTVDLPPDSDDLAVKGLIEWVGYEQLRLMIQKYFPEASGKAYIRPVSGGWSDAKLCRLFLDDDENLYFMKFFTRSDEYKSELSQHAAAKLWLRDSTVELKLVPDIAGGIDAQVEAFPRIGNQIYPVCYESASTYEHPRETYKELYRLSTDDIIEGALQRLLEILSANQNMTQIMQPPWSDTDERAFRRTRDLKTSVLGTVDDLAQYGPPMCFGDKGVWDSYYRALQEIVYARLPDWLGDPSPVYLGHVHGDPNPRNCLVNPDDVQDIRLIDCGGYMPDGRLVSDLALIERDIKLVLMSTERDAGGFLDLDVNQLSQYWCQAERDAISRRLNYAPDNAPINPSPVRRAYRLIGHIRTKANEVSPEQDKEGKQYFAALLYWTLDILKYKAVRSTKKLLALYSAGEIIRTFK